MVGDGLVFVGQVLGVERRTVEPREGQNFAPFEQQTLHVVAGFDKVALRVGRDIYSLPEAGERVRVQVVASAYPTKAGGAGLQLTALGWEPVDEYGAARVLAD